MSKVSSKSPVTGLRRISKDRKQASAIRRRLAAELMELVLTLKTSESSPILVRTIPGSSYNYAGAEYKVTPEQAMTFGLELVKKGILKSVTSHGDTALLFVPTRQGMMQLIRGSSRVWEVPKAEFTYDIPRRQKAVDEEKASGSPLTKSSTSAQPKSAELPAGVRGIKIDVSRAIQNIDTVDPLKLIALWENAHRILEDEDKKVQHAEIRAAILSIETEWKRRNDSGDPDQYFEWPTTHLLRRSGELVINAPQKDGVLSRLDYHVGISHGQPEVYRRRILVKAFEGPLPRDLPHFELDQWGPENSAKRLKKIAYSIATFVKNAKGRNPVALDVAIKEWEADLRFLREHYYVGRFDFPWPSTRLSEM